MWRLRSRLFEHIIHQEVGFFDRVRTGELMNRLSEVRSLKFCISTFLCQGGAHSDNAHSHLPALSCSRLVLMVEANSPALMFASLTCHI